MTIDPWAWWLRMWFPPPNCQKAHNNVAKAAEALKATQQELSSDAKTTSRHSARNIRRLMRAFAARLERSNASP